ncbi:hypothetical protein [Metabacillus endolithicus]|uniref:Uncharacterized protein n=1 Tax=Metabacillus endolithicus TaxID=1535204 RepID=A0ABW5BRW7_9BACI|nr:hypothetical protein [Metabacillus endolithicus]UPG63792.1 hypothetical protein MVE64_01050 [Metabacillus endolithicus]
MLLYPPEQFDKNEWAIIFGVLFNILIFTVLPKRIPKEITPLIVLLSISFPKVMDHTMGVKPFNYYNLTDTYKYEIFDVVLYAVYPAFGYLFVYLIHYLDLKGFKRVLYFLSWTAFAFILELFLVKLNVYVYNGWKIIYSLPVYSIVLSLTYLFYIFLIAYRNKELNQNPTS